MAPRYKSDTWCRLVLAILLTMSDVLHAWTSVRIQTSKQASKTPGRRSLVLHARG